MLKVGCILTMVSLCQCNVAGSKDLQLNTLLHSQTDSPCIGYCSTALGDDVCRGCGRTFEEVTFWNVYSDEEKKAVMHRLQALKQKP